MAFEIKSFEDLPEATLPLTGGETVALVQNGVTVRATLGATVILASYTVATLPAAAPGTLVLVTDEVGGEVPAFRDHFSTWRRVTDRAVVS